MTIELAEDRRLLGNDKFRRLLQARLAGQTAQNAMFYALLILLVEESGSSIHSTLLVVALTLPSIILGIPGGTLADLLPRRFTLTLGYASRAAVAGLLFYYSSDLIYVYLLVLVHGSIGQLFGPAEAATIPAVVRRDQLPAANSLMTLALGFGQIMGLVVMAPILIKVFSPDAVFLVCAALFILATYVVALLASGFTRAQDERPPTIGFMDATREGFRILRSDRHTYLAMVYLTSATALGRVLIILLPKYTRDVLEIAPEDTVFVAAPAAIGAGIGLAIVPLISKMFGAWRIVVVGFILYIAGLIALGLVVLVRDFIVENFDPGISFVEDDVGVSSLITVTMIIAVPLGFANTLVAVASRVVMNEKAPAEAQGRIYAVQTAIADALSLVPLLFVGIAADVAGARATLLASALAALALSLYLTFSRRFGPPSDQPEANQPSVGPEPEQATLPG